MNINGNKLIRLLSRPEWDEEVRAMLEFFNLGSVNVSNDKFSDEFYLDKYNVTLGFSYVPATKSQYQESESGNLYFRRITFNENCTLSLPFDLEIGDTYAVAIQKIKNFTPVLHRYTEDAIDRLVIEDKEKKYFLLLGFTENESRSLEEIVVYLYDVKNNYKTLKSKEVRI